ncbi:MAG: hypothetical protein LKF79_01695 [Solobacterium sp.]|jgi:hypothetical protein|nr:hypothetical protein [Solobacterium sp.]MCH4265341.1 hypothetical protein [Solobacterium sp.]
MKETIQLIGITLGRRKSRYSKVQFINTISQSFLDAGLKPELNQKSKLGAKITNLFVGDMDADTIVIAGYDTPSRILQRGYKYYPLDQKKNLKAENSNIFLHLLFIVPAVIDLFFLRNFANLSGTGKTGMIILTIILFPLALYGIFMPTARFNYNRNSISVAVLYSLVLQNICKVGYVFADYTASTYVGYNQIRDFYGTDERNKTFIILDALANSKDIYVVGSKQTSKEARKLAGMISAKVKILDQVDHTPLQLFTKTIYITGGEDVTDELQVSNCRSNQDYHVDVERCENIRNGISEYLKH